MYKNVNLVKEVSMVGLADAGILIITFVDGNAVGISLSKELIEVKLDWEITMSAISCDIYLNTENEPQ